MSETTRQRLVRTANALIPLYSKRSEVRWVLEQVADFDQREPVSVMTNERVVELTRLIHAYKENADITAENARLGAALRAAIDSLYGGSELSITRIVDTTGRTMLVGVTADRVTRDEDVALSALRKALVASLRSAGTETP